MSRTIAQSTRVFEIRLNAIQPSSTMPLSSRDSADRESMTGEPCASADSAEGPAATQHAQTAQTVHSRLQACLSSGERVEASMTPNAGADFDHRLASGATSLRGWRICVSSERR